MLIDRTGHETMIKAAETAYAAYPELQSFDIHIFYSHTGTATMQARPRWDLLWRKRKRRSYQVRINPSPRYEPEREIHELPANILIGWFAHEFGHLMDYLPRKRRSMLGFLFQYLWSPGYRRVAERTADTFAIQHGLGSYILQTKEFLLAHRNISAKYRARLLKHYLTPQQTMELIEEHEGPLMEE